MCRNAGILIGWDHMAKHALVTGASCDSWGCAECRSSMSERWGLRATLGCAEIVKSGKRLDFVTITSHERLCNFAQTEKVWRVAWHALYCALRRVTSDLRYMIVPERHKDGRMHVHALWDAGVSQKWLKDNARQRGLGYQCKVLHISTERYAAKYVIKYVGKDLGSDCPAHFRRVRVSRNWADIPEPATSDTNLHWEYVGTNGAVSVVYAECRAKSYTVIRKRTGEILREADLLALLPAS